MDIQTPEDLDQIQEFLHGQLIRLEDEPDNQECLKTTIDCIEELKSFYVLFPTPEAQSEEGTIKGFSTTAEILAQHGPYQMLGEVIDRLELLTSNALSIAEEQDLEPNDRLAVMEHQNELEVLMKKTHQALLRIENLPVAQALAERP